jgi:anaerobic magnesium-protoporphyrin IX monomethyl ester cyclase
MISIRQGTVILIGYQDKENLGLRYISSYLKRRGHNVWYIALPAVPDEVLKKIKKLQPDIVGFSLIFQNFTPDFASLISFLRSSGCPSHFTMGGHYPSFDYIQVLESIPELDSIVRFEGEETLASLLGVILAGRSLDGVKGLAWRDASGNIVANPLRRGHADLDLLPWPDRSDLNYKSDKISTASMIGSRGCCYNCAFCSITNFYRQSGTPGRRWRDPVDVVDEMEMLHNSGADVILFQDDDFLVGGKPGTVWAHSIANEIINHDLQKILHWRISCRSDEVRRETLTPLVRAGLSHVYLGVESGDMQDLIELNKKLTPEIHLSAKKVIQELDLTFDFGFMLLNPWSTFETIRNNLKFLREFVGDGEAPTGFCRTLPYAGTTITERLKKEGRLSPGFLAEYNFIDPRLDVLHKWLYHVFNKRNNDPYGTRNLLSVLLFEVNLDLPKHPRNPLYLNILRAITSVSNRVMIDTVETALDYFESLEKPPLLHDPFLTQLGKYHEEQDRRIREDLKRWCNARIDRTLVSTVSAVHGRIVQ